MQTMLLVYRNKTKQNKTTDEERKQKTFNY